MDRIVRSDALTLTATGFLAANLVHGADHVRQHMAGLNMDVKIGGALITAAAVATLILVRRRHTRAPLIATIVGFVSAALVAQSHLAPHWSRFSDSYLDDIHPDVVSWIIACLEVVAALVLGLVGAHRLLRHDRKVLIP